MNSFFVQNHLLFRYFRRWRFKIRMSVSLNAGHIYLHVALQIGSSYDVIGWVSLPKIHKNVHFHNCDL